MLTNMKKKTIVKIHTKIQNFEKRNEWSGDMVNSYLLTKLGIDSVNGFWENAFYGLTDAHTTALALLTQSSRAKKQSGDKADR